MSLKRELNPGDAEPGGDRKRQKLNHEPKTFNVAKHLYKNGDIGRDKLEAMLPDSSLGKRKRDEADIGDEQRRTGRIIEGNQNVMKKVQNMAGDALAEALNRLTVAEEIKKEEAEIKKGQDLDDYYRQREKNEEF